MDESEIEFVRALYPYTGADQAVPLPFAESTVLQVVERNQNGWCRGFSAGKEGWFPISYVKPLANSELIQKGMVLSSLVAVMHSSDWIAYSTAEDKIYFVNTQTQATTWEVPSVSLPPPRQNGHPSIPSPGTSTNGDNFKLLQTEKPKTQKQKKPKYRIVNGVTFVENGPKQSLLNPSEVSYVDHFWADKGDQTGYDIILEKHLNGKFVMKDMMEFFRERAAIEEQYAKSLMKLSKSTLADNEEGTLGKAWQSLKAELRYRSEAHSKFAEELQTELEKKIFEYKESQKKGRKEHQHIMEKSRKQVQSLDANIDKMKGIVSGKPKNLKKSLSRDSDPASLLAMGRRKSSAAGDDIKKMEESYNQAQRQWMDDMINACQDYEKFEEERSDFIKDRLLKYVDICVGVDETSALSLTHVTDAIDRIKKKADKEYFIKTRGTGSLRPVERLGE